MYLVLKRKKYFRLKFILLFNLITFQLDTLRPTFFYFLNPPKTYDCSSIRFSNNLFSTSKFVSVEPSFHIWKMEIISCCLIWRIWQGWKQFLSLLMEYCQSNNNASVHACIMIVGEIFFSIKLVNFFLRQIGKFFSQHG